MTKREALAVIAMIAARYPTPAMTQETLRLWAEIIVDLDHDAAKAAAMAWFRSQEERLDPARLRRLVAEAQASAAGSPYLDPDAAWGYVVEQFSVVGGYRDFPATHPLVADVVRAMGWPTLCQSDNPEADRAHFLQLYRQRLERARRDDATTDGAQPLAALGERRAPTPTRPAIEHRATAADARALVASVAAKIGRPSLPPPTPVADLPPPTITDAGELARREARRRELLGLPAHDGTRPEGRP